MSNIIQSPGSVQENGDVSSGARQTENSGWNNWAMFKAFALRILITYFIFNLFHRSPLKNNMNGKEPVRSATNLYKPGTGMDLFVYLSENSVFDSFNKTEYLVWHQSSFVYGDWKGGPNKDGSFDQLTEIQCSQVCFESSFDL